MAVGAVAGASPLLAAAIADTYDTSAAAGLLGVDVAVGVAALVGVAAIAGGEFRLHAELPWPG